MTTISPQGHEPDPKGTAPEDLNLPTSWSDVSKCGTRRWRLPPLHVPGSCVARPEGLEPPTSDPESGRFVQFSCGRKNCQVLQGFSADSKFPGGSVESMLGPIRRSTGWMLASLNHECRRRFVGLACGAPAEQPLSRHRIPIRQHRAPRGSPPLKAGTPQRHTAAFPAYASPIDP